MYNSVVSLPSSFGLFVPTLRVPDVALHNFFLDAALGWCRHRQVQVHGRVKMRRDGDSPGHEELRQPEEGVHLSLVWIMERQWLR